MTAKEEIGSPALNGIQLDHRAGRYIEAREAGSVLFRYVYFDPEILPNETPKPYIHPLVTLGGRETTGYRPKDHPWHVGLTMTIPAVGDDNFWGGNTYVPGEGYIQLANNGTIRHEAWAGIRSEPDEVRMDEELAWVSIAGERVLTESRRISLVGVARELGAYAIELEFALTNVTDGDLPLRSPATKGLAGMGYWGMHWRGSLTAHPGSVFSATGERGDADITGRRAEWIAYTCPAVAGEAPATLIFLDLEREERFPAQWFARSDSMASITPSFVFDEPYELRAGQTLRLAHRVIVCDGELDRGSVTRTIAHFKTLSGMDAPAQNRDQPRSSHEQ
ncbi:PmoA family protein [Lysobacter korlensis]|uniref:PmoA family protein n=1 Tax=Lysobacter korlensis TaxID=553636 RepID=A0ABV6RT30_9GAMM